MASTASTEALFLAPTQQSETPSASSFDWEGSLFPPAGLEALLIKQEPLDSALSQLQDLGDLYSSGPSTWLSEDTNSLLTLSSTDLLFDILKKPLVPPALVLGEAPSISSLLAPAPLEALCSTLTESTASASSSAESTSGASLPDEDGHASSEDYLALLATSTSSPIDSDALSSLFSEDEDFDFGGLEDIKPATSSSRSKRSPKVPAPKSSRKASSVSGDDTSTSESNKASGSGATRRRKHVQDMSEEERIHVRELGRLAAQRSRQARRQRWLDLKRRGKSLNEAHTALTTERTSLLTKLDALKKQLKASFPSMVASWNQQLDDF